MNLNKYSNASSILNLIEIDLEQRMHQKRLSEIARARVQTKSRMKASDKTFQHNHHKIRNNRLFSNLYRDLERVQAINQMNYKISQSIQRELVRHLPQKKSKKSKRKAHKSAVPNKSYSQRKLQIEEENHRLMDKLLQIQNGRPQNRQQFEKDFDKHREYKQRIRRYSYSNKKSLHNQVESIGLELRLILPKIK